MKRLLNFSSLRATSLGICLPKLHSTVVAFALACCTITAQAQSSDASADVARMLRSGQTDQAAARVEAGLSANPRDAQLRFLRGVIQIEQKRVNDAIVTFQRMTEDFPELPEPYNNLAVLYAGQGQYDKARAALELAIRTHPSYATAHENLGDVYTKMASESYSKALQLDAGNDGAQVKLNLIRSLSFGKTERPVAPTGVPAPVAVAAAPAVPRIPAAGAVPLAAAPASTVAAAPNASAQATAKPVQTSDESDVVYAAVVAWAKAWGAQNTAAYIASYSKSFAPSSGESRKKWEADRKARIEGKRSIAVSLESPLVEVTGNRASVKFRQIYEADSLSTKTRKTLKLQKIDGDWKIVEEIAGA